MAFDGLDQVQEAVVVRMQRKVERAAAERAEHAGIPRRDLGTKVANRTGRGIVRRAEGLGLQRAGDLLRVGVPATTRLLLRGRRQGRVGGTVGFCLGMSGPLGNAFARTGEAWSYRTHICSS